MTDPIENARQLLIETARYIEAGSKRSTELDARLAELRAAAEALPHLNALIVEWETEAAATREATSLYDQGKSAGIHTCILDLKEALRP